MFEKFIVAFIGTLILCAVAFVAVFTVACAFRFYGMWGVPISTIVLALIVGLFEILPKSEPKP